MEQAPLDKVDKQKLEKYKQKLHKAQEKGNKHEEGQAYRDLGIFYYERVDCVQAIKYHELNLKISKEVGDRDAEIQVNKDLSNCYVKLGDYEQCIGYDNLLLSIAREVGDEDEEARLFRNLGFSHYKLEEYEQAIQCLERCLALSKKVGNRDEERIAYKNLSACYDGLEDYNQCIEYGNILLSVAEEDGDKGEQGVLYGNLGFYYDNLKNYKQAIKCHKLCLRIAKEVGNIDEQRRACSNLIYCYDKLENWKESIKYGNLLLGIAKEKGDMVEEGRLYGDLGSCYLNHGNYKQARKHHELCLAIAREVGDRDEERRALIELRLLRAGLEEVEEEDEEVGLRVPSEIRARGPRAKTAYKNALRIGKVKVYRARIMLIGQDRVGKTSLKKSLLGLPFDSEEQSTVGIEVDPSSFRVDIDPVNNWQRTDQKAGVSQFAEELARMAAEELERDEVGMDRKAQDKSEEKRSHTTQVPVTENLTKFKNLVNSSSPVNLEESTEKKKQEGHHTLDKRQNLPKTPLSKITVSSHQAGKSGFVSYQESVLENDPSLPPEEFTQCLIQYLKGLNLQSDSSSTEPVVDMDLWDLAGQHLYYASHPVFFSPRALYLLVCNLSKGLNNIAEPYVRQGIHDVRLENPNGETNLENLLSWLVTISAICPTKQENTEKEVPFMRPPVLVVGTHADRPFQDIGETFLQIKKGISGKDYGRHVITQFFSIDNTQLSSDAGVGKLRKEIVEVLKQEPYMGEEVPVRWFNFEKVVKGLVATNTFYLNIERIHSIVQKVCLIEGKTEVDAMLNFYHDLGMIVKHGSTVVLQAQWLIDLFKQLITIPRYEDVGHETKHIKNWRRLEETGVLCMGLVRHVFSKFIKEDRVTEKDILDMMERFGLIAKFSTLTDDKYFVPAQLRSSPKDLCEMEPSAFDPCPLYLDFLNGFVPHGIFYQLVTRFIRWCSDIGCKEPPSLFDHAVRFFLKKQVVHQLILICKKRYIKILLNHREEVHEAYLAEAEDVASGVRNFLVGTLKDLSRQIPWRGNLRYELCVMCPLCPVEGNMCSDHGKISCTHEDCLCLLKMERPEKLICLKSLCKKKPTVPGLKKWFSSKTLLQNGRKDKTEYWCPAGEDSEEAKHILQNLRQMQDNPGRITRETNQVLEDLRKIASEKGFRVSDNQGSGNCMFYALSEQLQSVLGIRMQHEEVRNTLAQFLKKNPKLPDGTHLFCFVDGYQSWDDYLSKMEKVGTWGDHVILRAAANCFETCIHVVSSLPHVNDVIIRPDRGEINRKPLVLGQVHEIHYVSLLPIQGMKRLQIETSSVQEGDCAKKFKTDQVIDLVKQGIPGNDELEEIGAEIAQKWKTLGRRLGVKEAKLQHIHQAHEELCEKGYQMLIHWKQEQGCAATYQALCDALKHKLVQRQDLAEQFYNLNAKI